MHLRLMLRPRTQRLRFAFAHLTRAQRRAASLYSFGTRPFAFRESTSRTAASQPSPRTQRLRFAFARLATRK